MLDTPAVIRLGESMAIQRLVVTVEDDIDTGVAVDVGSDLNVLIGELACQCEEFVQRVVEHGPTGAVPTGIPATRARGESR